MAEFAGEGSTPEGFGGGKSVGPDEALERAETRQDLKDQTFNHPDYDYRQKAKFVLNLFN